jgi:glycerol-3-phosphate dehydrogenase
LSFSFGLFPFYPVQRQGENISGAMMHEILREVDVNSNGLVELDEFLQVD